MKKYVSIPLLIISFIVGTLTLVCGYSCNVHPEGHRLLALFGLAFPFLLALTLASLVFWLNVKKVYALVPLVFLVASFVPVSEYTPLNLQNIRSDSERGMRVLSWNVHCFTNPYVEGENTFSGVFDYIIINDFDIVCLQEAIAPKDSIERFHELYPYVITYGVSGSEELLCMSKFPITKVEPISNEGDVKCSACFHIKTDKGMMRVVNNHFQSIGFATEDKEEFRSIVEGGIKSDTGVQESKRLLNTIYEGMRKRAPQAEAVAKFVGDSAKMTLVVGDFNDTPISYTHRCLDRKLTDCYMSGGLLPGFSYTKDYMFVRIDHAFCSSDMDVRRYWVDNDPKYSDHYPLGVSFTWEKDAK